ncbi:MAG: signal recognition particle receptor subunit alpha, partial [Gammaproteobacteria bacterium]
MFENLTDRLSKTLKNLRGQGRLTEDNIKDSLRQVRMALLEADVALPVVRDLIERIRLEALGKDVIGSLSPGQALIKVVNDELVAVMGHQHEGIDLNNKPPVTILMAGLQGAGKTTTVAKLARRLIEVDKKNVVVASADIYRPAAISQLQILSDEVNATFYPSD